MTLSGLKLVAVSDKNSTQSYFCNSFDIEMLLTLQFKQFKFVRIFHPLPSELYQLYTFSINGFLPGL